MIKFLLKIVLFIGLIIFVISLAEKFFIKDDRFNYSKYEFNKMADTTRFGIIFFGSSKSYCAYNPTVFNQKLGVNAYNLAGQGQVLEVTNFVFGETLKKTKPELLVMDLSYNMIRFNNNDSLVERSKSFQLKIFDNYGLSLTKLKYILNIYKMEDVLFLSSPLIRNHDSWTDIPKELYKKPFIKNRNNMYLSNNGYIGTMHDISKSGLDIAEKMKMGYDYLKNLNSLKVTNRELNLIDQIAFKANSNDVEVLFVSTPSIKGYVNHLSYYSDLEQQMKNRGYKYLNLNKHYYDIGLRVTDFKDIQHMNFRGGFKTSLFLSKYIARHYNFNSNSNNNFLNKNITYHLMTHLDNTNKLLNSQFQFNQKIIVDEIGYFNEFENTYSFIFKLNKQTDFDKVTNFIGYIRYYNGETIKDNKKVQGFPLELLEIEGYKYIFARINVENTKISKFDVFFLEKESKKASKFFTVKDLKL